MYALDILFSQARVDAEMSLDRVIGVLVTVTLAEMMVLGLQVTLADLSDVLRDWKLVARATVVNYLVVPGMTLGLMILFHVNPTIATGFLIVAACPGAPYGPPLAGIARADVGVSVGLMVILAGSSALISPVLLKRLLPWLSGGEAGRWGERFLTELAQEPRVIDSIENSTHAHDSTTEFGLFQ